MADIKAQLKAKNGDNLYPVTSLAYVSAVSSGGIVISGNSIYTSAIPQANVYRLTTSLGAKQAKCSAGFRTYVSGATIGQNRYFDIAAPVSSGTLTVSAGSAYRIFATGNTVTVNAEGSASSAGVFGLEGHAAILLTNSSYLKFGTNVVLGSPLQIDAINNCTLRFHDGHCIIDVEDHEAAHAVTVATGTGTGSLYYWANWANTTSASATPAYISFSDALDGTACSFNGVTVAGDKHFVGNGKTLTVVTGTATASSKTYLTNMAISGATITGGAVYATDCLIPSGATTVISSPLIASNTLDIDGTLKTPGGLVPVKELTISGGTLNLAGKYINWNGNTDAGKTFSMSNCVVIGGSNTANGGAVAVQNGAVFSAVNCTFTGNTGSLGGAIAASNGSPSAFLSGCSFYSNTGAGGVILLRSAAVLTIEDCWISGQQIGMAGAQTVNIGGSNVLGTIVNGNTNGTVIVSSGAILDLTGNANATPIKPGAITFEAGGATVYPSAGVASAYAIGGVNVPQLGNTNVIDMAGSRYTALYKDIYISGCTFTNGNTSAVNGYYYLFQNCRGSIDNCTFAQIPNKWGDYVYVAGSVNVTISNSNIIALAINSNGAQLTLNNVQVSLITFRAPAGSIVNINTYLKVVRLADNTGSGTVYIASGTTIQLSGTAPQYVSASKIIVATGGCNLVTTTGTTVSVPAGTYTRLLNDGTYS